MSDEQFKAFQAAVEADAGLQEQLKAVTDPDAVVAVAKAAGFVITAEELARAQAVISENELAGVPGGGGNEHDRVDGLESSSPASDQRNWYPDYGK